MTERPYREVIAFRSTEGEGEHAKDRWVELEAVRLNGAVPGFLLHLRKKSRRRGEHTIHVKYRGLTVEELFRMVPMSTPVVAIRTEVRQWARENGHG